MHIMKQICKLIFLFLLCAGNTTADYNFHFSHLGVESGLSQMSVFKIFQDSEGYLWFGTQNGLNKYNGYEFEVYKNEVNNPESLSDGYIHAINEDKEGNIWVGTRNGLNCIDRLSGKITRHYPRTIDSTTTSNTTSLILKHADNHLYAIVGNNVFRCNSDQSVQPFKKLQDLFPQTVYAVEQDDNKDIYISTSQSMYIYSEDWELKKKYSIEKTNFPQSRIVVFLSDSDNIWIGTFQNGIYSFNKQDETFTSYNSENTQLSNNSIRTLTFLDENSILAGTFGGLNILDKKNHRISPISMSSGEYGGLDHFSVHSALLDKDRTLWVGTYSAGINYHSPYQKAISYIPVDKKPGTIGKGQEDKDGNMWFATEGGGLLFFKPETKEQVLYPLKPLTTGNREINIFKSILIDGDAIYCSTHYGSVYKFSIAQKKYELLYDFKVNDIHTLHLDSRQRLWIPTFGSSHLIIAENGKTDNIFLFDGTQRFFPGITAILEYMPNVFILGSYHGQIYRLDMNHHTVTDIHLQLPLNEQEQIGTVSSIVNDSSFIWIATAKMGLFRFDYDMKLIKHYNNNDGISDSYISSAVVDKNNNLWIATGNEIFRLNRNDDKLYSINPTASAIQEYTIHSGSAASDGTIYFPGNKGIVSFSPRDLKENPTIPPVHITSLMTNNNDITNDIKVRYDKEKNRRNYSVTLNSNQNNISIGYTALNYIHSNGNKYMFILENADRMWQNVGSRREAYYSNLLPGNYTFRLKASNNDGVWNPEETVLSILVKPPLHKTWWAYTLYTCFVLTSVVLIVNYRHKKRKLEQDIRYRQIEQDKLKELHEERTRMYANFSHELKTPLTLIMNPLEDLTQKASFSPEVKNSLLKMKKNTGKMLSLVNNLMDVQKYVAGKSVLKKKQFNFSSFIEEIYKSFESIADSRGIIFKIKNELPPHYIVCYDETEIEKVFSNLLSNAFKFTDANGLVTITVQRTKQGEDNYISIQVTDTGKGFSEEQAKVIFEPFYQFGEDLHRQISGTGIGLSLVRSVVMQHDGSINAESKEQVGSTFTVLLPDTETQSETDISEAISEQVSVKIKEAHLLVEKVENKNKKTILLVENDQDILLYLEEQLRPDYLILKAGDGKEALDLIKDKTLHLVISDIMMPAMNGIELCRKIKSRPDLYHIPVILLTGKSDEFQKKQGFDVGADDYITKPFDITILKTRIKNLVENREKVGNAYGNTLLLKNLGIDEAHVDNKFLNKYIEFIKSNISDQELDVSVIYKGLGMSRANFYRKVKEITDLSPAGLIKNIRLHAGAQLLSESDKNISEIAQIIGFSGRSFFARSFKAEYGISPSEYQMKNRKKKTEVLKK